MNKPEPQATIATQEDGVLSPALRAALTPLVDELLNIYVSWREECASVAAAYENWRASERRDDGLAFSAYLAALDREEHAAETYRSLVEHISEVHRGGTSTAQRSARGQRSGAAGGARWDLRGIGRNLRRRCS